MPLGQAIDSCTLRLRSWRPFDKRLGSINGQSFARKRRRRGGSRSIPRRSSDRRCLSANGTCSDFLMATGSTDSSVELFGEAHWASDASERNLREKEGNSGREREFVISGYGLLRSCDIEMDETGYGSEPGYKGDAELEYGDELDGEEDDQQDLFWGEGCGGNTSQLEMVGEKPLQKGHHRRRHKKHDLRMVDTLVTSPTIKKRRKTVERGKEAEVAFFLDRGI